MKYEEGKRKVLEQAEWLYHRAIENPKNKNVFYNQIYGALMAMSCIYPEHDEELAEIWGEYSNKFYF